MSNLQEKTESPCRTCRFPDGELGLVQKTMRALECFQTRMQQAKRHCFGTWPGRADWQEPEGMRCPCEELVEEATGTGSLVLAGMHCTQREGAATGEKQPPEGPRMGFQSARVAAFRFCAGRAHRAARPDATRQTEVQMPRRKGRRRRGGRGTAPEWGKRRSKITLESGRGF